MVTKWHCAYLRRMVTGKGLSPVSVRVTVMCRARFSCASVTLNSWMFILSLYRVNTSLASGVYTGETKILLTKNSKIKKIIRSKQKGNTSLFQNDTKMFTSEVSVNDTPQCVKTQSVKEAPTLFRMKTNLNFNVRDLDVDGLVVRQVCDRDFLIGARVHGQCRDLRLNLWRHKISKILKTRLGLGNSKTGELWSSWPNLDLQLEFAAQILSVSAIATQKRWTARRILRPLRRELQAATVFAAVTQLPGAGNTSGFCPAAIYCR